MISITYKQLCCREYSVKKYFCLQCYHPFEEKSIRYRIKNSQSKFLGFVHEKCYSEYTGKPLPEKQKDVKYLIPIDPKIFELGYKESQTKKGLFYKTCLTGTAYFDFRNVGELPREMQIQEGPMHYYFDNPMTWKSRRVRNTQRQILDNNNIKYRLSFYKKYSEEIEEFEMDEGDGFCKFCKKDFEDEGVFCEKACEKMYLQKHVVLCEACQTPVTPDDEILHHVEYFPEEIVSAHTSCHQKIHKTMEYADLRPPEGDSRKYYKKSSK